MGLSFRDDAFLRNLVDLAVLVDLRALIYKARIPVANGNTLHGRMDETGVLEEGQIFSVAEEDGRSGVPGCSSLIITRSPALHPGDVQTVTAAEVPDGSPYCSSTTAFVSAPRARDTYQVD
jgi:hypothetical protein